MEIIKVSNLSKHFNGLVAVDELSFVVESGTICALIGPNGSGKTVTFNILTGLYRPSAGSILFANKEISGSAQYKIANMGMGRTFQNIRLFSQMTVLENVMLGLNYDGEEGFWAALLRRPALLRKDSENAEKAIDLLRLLGLEEKKDELAETLSYGQRKLVEIARTLGTDSKFYLFDEPTAGVFPNMINKLLEIIRGLKAKGKTILFIEHNMDVVMGMADKVIVLNYGKKIAEGIPSEIQNNGAVLEAYLGRRRIAS